MKFGFVNKINEKDLMLKIFGQMIKKVFCKYLLT